MESFVSSQLRDRGTPSGNAAQAALSRRNPFARSTLTYHLPALSRSLAGVSAPDAEISSPFASYLDSDAGP